MKWFIVFGWNIVFTYIYSLIMPKSMVYIIVGIPLLFCTSIYLYNLITRYQNRYRKVKNSQI